MFFDRTGILTILLLGLSTGCAGVVEDTEPAGALEEAIVGSEINRTYRLAFGREPTQAEINYWNSRSIGIAGAIQAHSDWLASSAGATDRRDTIRRSYETAFRRPPSACEANYWDSYITSRVRSQVTYRELCYFHDQYGRNNGLPKTGTATYQDYHREVGWFMRSLYTYDAASGC
jgi:hypothetical protein